MTLSYDVAGDGPTLLLLHSAVCDRRMWDPQWSSLLEAGYRLIRCDFRGYGQVLDAGPVAQRRRGRTRAPSTPSTSTGSRSSAPRSVAGSPEVAARWPDRVTELALLCSALAGHARGPELSAYNAKENELISAGDVAGAVDLNVDTWLGPDADAEARELVRRMQRQAFDVQLPPSPRNSSRCPPSSTSPPVRARCLAVSGAHDLPDFREIAAALPGLLPDARHVELPWAGHLPNLERPAETTKLLTDFLRAPSED